MSTVNLSILYNMQYLFSQSLKLLHYYLYQLFQYCLKFLVWKFHSIVRQSSQRNVSSIYVYRCENWELADQIKPVICSNVENSTWGLPKMVQNINIWKINFYKNSKLLIKKRFDSKPKLHFELRNYSLHWSSIRKWH